MRRSLLVGSLALLASCSTTPRAATVAYKNASLAPDVRARDLLARMTLQEKFWQLWMVPGDLDGDRNVYRHGVFGLQVRERDTTARPAAAWAQRDAERLNAIQHFFVDSTRLGIPIIPFEEALHGLYARGATSFPQAIALAATWDTAAARAVGAAIAREAGSRGVRQVLSPVINIGNDPRWGRVEETFGEDPRLASAMAVAFVTPLERAGIVTTPKHFVANLGDGGRDSYPVEFSERQLREIHFPPFLAAIKDGGARSVMASYNSVDGTPATANPWLLTTVLRDDWGFTGIVIGDQSATGGAHVLHFTSPNNAISTKQAIEAGLDVIFQSSVEQYPSFLAAFERGLIDPRAIDRAVLRVLRLKFALGLFEQPYVDPARAAADNATAEHRALALDVARKAIVLLKNERNTLPLPRSLRSIAVIGTDAVEARQGGYSADGNARVSLLDWMRRQRGPTTIRYAPGPGRISAELVAVPSSALWSDSAGVRAHGVDAEYYDNPTLTGTPVIRRREAQIDGRWTLSSPGRGVPYDWFSARWTGTLRAPVTGRLRLGVQGNDGYRLRVAHALVIDDWAKRSFGTRTVTLDVVAGRDYPIELDYFESTGNARLRLVWDQDAGPDPAIAIAAAVDSAKRSDVAVIVAGLEEGEFRDRSSLALPGQQEALIEAVAAAGKPTVVVLIGGSAVTMGRWIDKVGAVVDAWYPGEAGGTAIAAVLQGDLNPSGRLPITFPMSEGQLPLVYNHKPTGRGDDYLDGSGMAAFPFGFGLSYSSFSYRALDIAPAIIGPRDSAVVRFTVRNDGPLDGDEVVQLYVRDEITSVAQPLIALKQFARHHLRVGEERELRFTLGPTDLGLLDARLRRVVEPGTFRVMVGASSKDIRLRGRLTVR